MLSATPKRGKVMVRKRKQHHRGDDDAALTKKWWWLRFKISATLFEGKTHSPPVFSPIFFCVAKRRPLIFFLANGEKTVHF